MNETDQVSYKYGFIYQHIGSTIDISVIPPIAVGYSVLGPK